MNHDILKFLLDILDSIDKIHIHISDIYEQPEFEKNVTVIDAVERRLAIIGEALFKANKLDTYLAITDKYKIIRLRHILVHEYDLVDKDTIWKIITDHLPVLKKEVEQLIDKIDGLTKH